MAVAVPSEEVRLKRTRRSAGWAGDGAASGAGVAVASGGAAVASGGAAVASGGAAVAV
jgi:hypothetical protein